MELLTATNRIRKVLSSFYDARTSRPWCVEYRNADYEMGHTGTSNAESYCQATTTPWDSAATTGACARPRVVAGGAGARFAAPIQNRRPAGSRLPWQDAIAPHSEVAGNSELMLLCDGNHGCANVTCKHHHYATDWLRLGLSETPAPAHRTAWWYPLPLFAAGIW